MCAPSPASARSSMLQRIAVDDAQPARKSRFELGERRQAAAVALDRDHRGAGVEQGAGQPAGPGPDLIDRLACQAGPGMAAIRASNWRSRMKFWPSALLA